MSFISVPAASSIHATSVGSSTAIAAGIEYWPNAILATIDNIGNSMLGMGVRGIGGAIAATTGLNLLGEKDGYTPDFRERDIQEPVVVPITPLAQQAGITPMVMKDIMSVKKDMGIVCADINETELGEFGSPSVPFNIAAIAPSRNSGYSRSLSA